MDYEYRAWLTILQGGYPGEWKGTSPANDPWHAGQESVNGFFYGYYFRDSNCSQNENSSQVMLKATESWTAKFDDETNNLIITISTKIESVSRDVVNGNPLKCGNWSRDIWIGRQNGGPYVIEKLKDGINYVHQISGPVDMGTETITIPPGGEYVRGSIYILSHVTGAAWTEINTDEMWAGAHFRNNRKPPEPEPEPGMFDYRPGANFDGSNWMSHNRHAGTAMIHTSGGWEEMYTHYNGAEGVRQSDDPPFIYTGSWQSMLNVGNDHWPDGNPYLKNN